MRMTSRAGMFGLGAAALLAAAATPAAAQELSEKSVRSLMEYAWSLVPPQFSKQDGTMIIIDKKNKKTETMVPLDAAREIIRVGRVSAHAQVCALNEEQILNHRSLMRREEDKKKWTDQQMVYINQLHLTTVMLLTGKMKLVEKDGDKEVVVEESKAATPTCSEEQKTKVQEVIGAYLQAGPNFKIPELTSSPIKAPPGTQPAATAAPAAPAAVPASAPAPAAAAEKK